MSIDYIDGFVLRRRPHVTRGIELGPASEPQDTSEQRSNTSLAGIYPRPILSLRKLPVFSPPRYAVASRGFFSGPSPSRERE